MSNEVKEEIVSTKPTVANIALSGEEVERLKDKRFKIFGHRTQSFKDRDHPGHDREKLVLTVKLLDNGYMVDYFPNKTSQKVLTAAKGRNMDLWINHEGEFTTASMNVAGNMKLVIFIKP